jgi:hypothetical protein
VRRLALILFWLASSATSRDASSAPGSRPTPPQRILLVVAADAAETEQLAQVAAELLGRLSVTVRADRVDRIDTVQIARAATPDSGYIARVFIDLREPRRVTLWFVDPAHDRILVRQLDRLPGSDEVMREELGHILETSTEGLLSGAEIGLPRAKVIGEAKTLPDRGLPSPEPQPKQQRALQFALSYEAQALSREAPVTNGPEASAWLALPMGERALGLWLTGQYRFPIHLQTDAAGARIEGGAWRAMATFDWPIQSRITLRAALGGGVDLTMLQPEATGATTATLASARLLAFAIMRASWGVDLRVSPTLSIGARAAVDIDVSNTRYVFAARDGDAVLMQPFAVRPALAVGIAVP